MKMYGLLFFMLTGAIASFAQESDIEPVPSNRPGIYQVAQIERKYGMFIHFGINTAAGLTGFTYFITWGLK